MDGVLIIFTSLIGLLIAFGAVSGRLGVDSRCSDWRIRG